MKSINRKDAEAAVQSLFVQVADVVFMNGACQVLIYQRVVYFSYVLYLSRFCFDLYELVVEIVGTVRSNAGEYKIRYLFVSQTE